MKNKKFLKALASFMLSGAAAIGCFALFGCGHTHTYSSDWVKTDPDKHWHEATCEHTDEKSGEAAHEFDANGKCTVCEYQKPQAPKHTHTPSTDWKTDENDHWKECTATDCDDKGVKLEKAAHTKNEDGTECIICHKEFEVGGEDDPAAALATAKTNAKATLASYVDADDYTTNATALENAITAGNTAIDAATTTEGVATALATAKAAIDEIKSDATIAEEAAASAAAALATAKTNAKAELTNYVDASKYTQNAAALEKAISDGKTAIDAATTTEGVETALATAKAAIDEIKTDAELGGGEEADSYTVTFDMHNIGTAPSAQTVNKDGYATQPETAPTATGYYFVGWYTDESYATEFDFENTAITKTTTVYACWSEDVVSAPNIAGETERGLGGTDYTVGKVTFSGGGKFDKNSSIVSYNTGGGSDYVLVELSGMTNTLSIIARGASGSGTIVTITKVEDSTTIKTFPKAGQGEYLEGCTQTTPIVLNNLEKGTYKIQGTASTRFNSIVLTERMVVSDPDSIKVTPQTVDFVIGSEFSSEGLGTVLHYKNGREDVITNVSVNKDAYKKNVPGKYPITVSYTLAGSTTPLTDTYYVYVYQVDSIALKTNATKQGEKTPAGNGTYINHAAQQVYFKGDKLNIDGYTVHLNSSVTVEGEEKKEKLFLYTPTADNFTGFEATEAGVKTVTLHAYDLSVEFDVLVMEAPDLSKESSVMALVSQRLDNAEVNAVLKAQLGLGDDGEIAVGKYYADQHACFFETIQQALDFLELANLDANASKLIMIDAGTYKEKLEITIPNLEISGGDLLNMGPDTSPNPDNVKIEWNSLYGVADESGYIQTTDSTATLNVRASATGFHMSGVTVSNYFNCEENFYKEFGIGYGEHRALAMLIQADKVGISNCKLLGYQDTLELFTGRQIITNTYISGTTDFIFGSNNTTYFKNCEIHSIKRWKNKLDAEGNIALETDGGYITAFKGNNQNDNDYVQYGAIFDDCHFTADEGVAAGNTAIARPWGKYAAVAVINSELGAHISKAGFDANVNSGSKNQRYVSMSGNKPTDSNVKFVEYGNYGAGALVYTAEDEEKDPTHVAGTAYAVAGIKDNKLLTESEASNYQDYSVIFGKKNGGLTYDDAWSGSFSIVTITISLDGGGKSETIYGYHGGTVSQAAIDAAVAKLLDEGKELDTLTYGDNQPFTADTKIDHGMQVKATQKNKEVKPVTVNVTFPAASAAESVLANASDKNNGVATVTLKNANSGQNKTFNLTLDGVAVTSGNQVNTSNGASETLAFELATGYTYKISVYSRTTSNGSSRNYTLEGTTSTSTMKQATADSTANTADAYKPCVWENVAAGNCKLTLDGNVVIALVVIVATPVAA